jgi:esterase
MMVCDWNRSMRSIGRYAVGSTSRLRSHQGVIPLLTLRSFSNDQVSSSPPTLFHTEATISPSAIKTTTAGDMRVVPLVFMHALLASHEHFLPLHRHIQLALDTTLLNQSSSSSSPMTLRTFGYDARNHGRSSHTSTHTMMDLVNDADHFLSSIVIPSVSSNIKPWLIGHSMGGKTALAYALTYSSRIGGIISLDAAPAAYTHTHSGIFNAMLTVEPQLATATSHKHIDTLLAPYLSDRSDRVYVISNVIPNGDKAGYRYRTNTKLLATEEHHIHGWPAELENKRYMSPSLFIGGTRSTRLTTPSYRARIPYHFGRALVEMVDAPHFVYNTQPSACANHIVQFLDKHAR